MAELPRANRPCELPPPERRLLEVDERLVRSNPLQETLENEKQEEQSAGDQESKGDTNEDEDGQLGFMQW